MLKLNCVQHGQALPLSLARDHLVQGAARRIGVLDAAMETIFRLFPLSTSRPLASDTLATVQINLHAFLMNLFGVFENWGWAFVLRHNLLASVGGRQGVGLFSARTQQHLGPELREHLTSQGMETWHAEYLKNYRDALAHRIPPYVPPTEFTKEEGEQYQRLEDEKQLCLEAGDLKRLDEVNAQQAKLGRPSWRFLHAFSEDKPPRPVLLHAQVVTDALTVVDCGRVFLANWDRTANP